MMAGNVFGCFGEGNPIESEATGVVLASKDVNFKEGDKVVVSATAFLQVCCSCVQAPTLCAEHPHWCKGALAEGVYHPRRFVIAH
jgi:threonine dehydrogenase-like Zn-dependent dehydrogenase